MRDKIWLSELTDITGATQREVRWWTKELLGKRRIILGTANYSFRDLFLVQFIKNCKAAGHTVYSMRRVLPRIRTLMSTWKIPLHESSLLFHQDALFFFTGSAVIGECTPPKHAAVTIHGAELAQQLDLTKWPRKAGPHQPDRTEGVPV